MRFFFFFTFEKWRKLNYRVVYPCVIDDLLRGRARGWKTDEYRQGHFTTPTALPADTNAGRAVGVCIGWMHIAHVACSFPAHATHTHNHMFKWIRNLGWEMRGNGTCQHQQMPCSLFSGGSFSPSFWNPWVFVHCCFSTFGTQTHCHFGSVYLSQALEWEGPEPQGHGLRV